MADVEVVIKIPEVLYWAIKQNVSTDSVYDAVKNGTLLPKGHGRLIDAKVAYKKFYSRCYAKLAKEVFSEVPTIIEVDMEGDCNV